MNKDYSYCSGVPAPSATSAKDICPTLRLVPLWWIPPAYKENLKQCPHFEKTYRNNNNPELLKGGEEMKVIVTFSGGKRMTKENI